MGGGLKSENGAFCRRPDEKPWRSDRVIASLNITCHENASAEMVLEYNGFRFFH